MNVFIWPTLSEIESNNGIGRVVHAQYRLLPKFGISPIGTPDQADLIVCHTQQNNLPRVDVLHCHGLYWTAEPNSGIYSKWHQRANKGVTSAARKARVVTVPSEWVGMPFKRDMRISPTVIGHGIDLNEWEVGMPGGYVLWNKNRPSDVCDPSPALKLAQAGIRTISTFMPQGISVAPGTLMVVGPQSHQDMKDIVKRSSVYLATVKETFGIGTLEAMACGVPVLGFRWGGTADLISHKVDGYLAEPGDIEGLVEGYHYIMEHRQELSDAARAKAETYTWEVAIQKYAELYSSIERSAHTEPRGVSVIITCYNYAPFVAFAIESVLRQLYVVDEIIVVDDGSTDNTQEVLANYAGRVKIIKQENQGVAAARNNGIKAATQPFIVCLDADDMLAENYIEVCRNAMLKDRSLGVTYTGLALVAPDGRLSQNAWPPEFDWELMAKPSVPPSSCIPVAAMFRRSMWERAGGYKQEFAPGEDTEFWVRGLSLGFLAQKVDDRALFWYRPHSGSASRSKVYKRIDGFHPWMRDMKYPMAAPSKMVPSVHSYSQPTVSVIIPVGDGHEELVHTAIDSLIGQSFRNWEVLVIDDTETRLDSLATLYPFIRLIRHPHVGAGASRNVGLDEAKAPLVLFLDADDYLHPDALQSMLGLYARGQGQYVYTHWFSVHDGEVKREEVPEYDRYTMLRAPQHAVTVLMDTQKARKIRFSERYDLLEDWDFFIRCAISGYHGMLLPEPLLYVRTDKGFKTREVMKNPRIQLERTRERYTDYLEGKVSMPGCCGGDGGASMMAAKAAIGFDNDFGRSAMDDVLNLSEPEPGIVRMEFLGETKGAVTYGGNGATPSGQQYRGGAGPLDKYVDVQAQDVDWMTRTGKFAVVSPTRLATQTPKGVPATVDIQLPVPAPKKPEYEETETHVKDADAPDWMDKPVVDEATEAVAKAEDGKTASGARRGRPRKS